MDGGEFVHLTPAWTISRLSDPRRKQKYHCILGCKHASGKQSEKISQKLQAPGPVSCLWTPTDGGISVLVGAAVWS